MSAGRLILHVGAPKCGSSSLQAALSAQPDFTSSDGERFRYAALTGEGEVIAGDMLRRRAAATLEKYHPSLDAPEIRALGETAIADIVARLNAMLASTSVVLSCEGWLARAIGFAYLHILDRIEARIEVVAYVRPQPEYLNSSWWQWGAWSGLDLTSYIPIEDTPSLCKWGAKLREWTDVEGVSAVHARLLAGDVVVDFFGALGCTAPLAPRINRSLPSIALRFLQRNRSLRLGPGASEIAFVLERALNDWPGGAPWVLTLTHVSAILDQCREDNEALLAMLRPEDRAIMSADRRWWSASAYADRRVERSGPEPADTRDVEALACALASALKRAERELALRHGDDARTLTR